MKANLVVATIGLALAASSTLASEAPASRAAVKAEFQQAQHAGKLHCTDYYDELASRPAPGTQTTRPEVVARLKAPRDPRLVGPLRSGTYNPFGTDLMRTPIYTRTEIKEDVLRARAQHALHPAGEAAEIG